MSILSDVPTGKIIKNYLDEYGITQKNLAKRINMSEKHISKFLNGNTRLTEEMALKLEKVFPPIPASYWLNYEAKYREALARKQDPLLNLSQKQLKDIAKRFHFKEVFKNLDWSLLKQANEMLKILQISDFANFEKVYANLPVSFMEDGGDLASIVVWLKLCEDDIEIQNNEIINRYSVAKLKRNLHELKDISNNPNSSLAFKNARSWLNDKGINLVIEKAIPNCKVRGAISCYRNNPSIFLSLRFKTQDNAWFALMHEIGHLLLHFDGKTPYIFYGEDETQNERNEEEANKFARDFFIDPKSYNLFIKNNNFTQGNIVRFAVQEKVQPGLLVGFLQHDKIVPFSHFRNLKIKFESIS